MRDLAEKKGVLCNLSICSRATSYEEYGNPVHRGTVRKLAENGISCSGKRAEVISKRDIEDSDLVLYMDGLNFRNLERILRNNGNRFYDDNVGKIHCLKSYTARGGDIADPWYTGNFDETYEDIVEGCEAFLDYLKQEGKL